MAEKEKPMCSIIGADGNIFNILGIASRTLKAIPHRACAEDALSDFLSDCIEIPQAYYRMSRDFCAR